MDKKLKTMDGNEAAAYISYAFTEVAAIYPITPSSPMAELVDEWSAHGMKNLFGQRVRLVEMQSEAGAAGAMHGALETGALAATYTASQGLLLMIPTLYRMAGQLHPGVLHVSARSVGTHAFSIFGEHSDVMACRQTGAAMLCSGSVQEVMDLAGVAHLSAIKGRVPFMHFFDGFRTSHEIQKVEVMDYQDLERMLDYDALDAFRKRSLNPEHPVMKSTVQNPDIYFQAREASNKYYEALPLIVEDYMDQVNKITGRDYKLFHYYGREDAVSVIVAMGSSSGTIRETVNYLNANGEKVGFLQVHLYRPFSIAHFLSELPDTVEKITVLDRTKEPGALGEPLYLDICGAISEMKKEISVYGGRYGLSAKDVTARDIAAVFRNMREESGKKHFTVGIEDDVTHMSLPLGEPLSVTAPDIINCKFWGLGSDGTVGANKNSVKIIGDHTDLHVQAYFEYDTKKSGGVTRSHLRFGKTPIIGSYLVTNADFAACHNQSYIEKYKIVQELKAGGIFLLNCSWNKEQLEKKLPVSVKRFLAQKKIKFYTIDAVKIAKEIGLGSRTNIILQAAFFKLTEIIPLNQAVTYMKQAVEKSYGKKGEEVVRMNVAAIDCGMKGIVEVSVPKIWADLEEECLPDEKDVPDFVRDIMRPVNALMGDSLPVSVFAGREDGSVPLGTSKYDKRGTSSEVPRWNPQLCLQCSRCSFVCPHAAIRPFLLNQAEYEVHPQNFAVEANGKNMKEYYYRIQIDPLDCMGCGVCIDVCPAKEKALKMEPLETQIAEKENWSYCLELSDKQTQWPKQTVKGSQFEQPLLEFSGACAGCGETPYMKLLTQLYGGRLMIANATGCTQAWGAAMPSFPYTTNKKGHGPAWSNSLFENNAEFALGMVLAQEQQRRRLHGLLEEMLTLDPGERLTNAIRNWTAVFEYGEMSEKASGCLTEALYSERLSGRQNEIKKEILCNKEHLTKKSVWMYGGDGWAYDIGYGGLDHVLASGEDVNILLVDTEVYSNTGGQASKASPVGATAQFAASGKKTRKKDLGMLAMSYGYVYVAQVAMGADMVQLLKAMEEAERYKGPSLIIAYAPCINHGLVKGMGSSQREMKRAVESGYWCLYRYNPDYKKEGKNPFILDSREPSMELKEFLMGEVRFAALTRTFPEEAERLFEEAETGAKEKYKEYTEMAQ